MDVKKAIVEFKEGWYDIKLSNGLTERAYFNKEAVINHRLPATMVFSVKPFPEEWCIRTHSDVERILVHKSVHITDHMGEVDPTPLYVWQEDDTLTYEYYDCDMVYSIHRAGCNEAWIELNKQEKVDEF